MAKCPALLRWIANVLAVVPVAVAWDDPVVATGVDVLVRVRCRAVGPVAAMGTVVVTEIVVATAAVIVADVVAVAMATAAAIVVVSVGSVVRWVLVVAQVALVGRAAKVAMGSVLQSAAGKRWYYCRF